MNGFYVLLLIWTLMGLWTAWLVWSDDENDKPLTLADIVSVFFLWCLIWPRLFTERLLDRLDRVQILKPRKREAKPR